MSVAHDDYVTGEHFDRTMGLVLDRLQDVEGRQLRPEQLEAAFAAGVRAALTDPGLVAGVMDIVAKTAQDRATAAAGRGVWWVIKSALSKWLIILVVVLMAAKVAGWDAAAKVGKMLSGAAS